MEKNLPYLFDVSFVEGRLRATNDPELFLASLRVFYTKENRNGSYITEVFAEKLALSAYNKPIVGKYLHQKKDFDSHSTPEECKAYGFVIPETLRWEDHLDKDGKVRTYAVYDVLLWAQYWQEAKDIISKPQSMEIDRDTIVGKWQEVPGLLGEWFVYDAGVIKGLCILGEDVEPCFEGASFFSINDESYQLFLKAISQYSSKIGGKQEMNFNVTGFDGKYLDYVTAINPDFNEQGNYTVNQLPLYIEGSTLNSISFSANDSLLVNTYQITTDGSVNFDSIETIDYKKKLNDEKKSRCELNDKYEALVAEYNELKANFDRLNTESVNAADSFNKIIESKDAELTNKDNEIFSLKEQIANYENEKKEALIQQFASRLPADVLSEIDPNKYTYDQLRAELSVVYTNFSFSNGDSQVRVPRQQHQENPNEKLASILKNYKK